jgi:hypothetical protein
MMTYRSVCSPLRLERSLKLSDKLRNILVSVYIEVPTRTMRNIRRTSYPWSPRESHIGNIFHNISALWHTIRMTRT